MADTLDTPQTKKMQRERGREARKARWKEKDTRFHTRELYRDPSAQQWQDYAEQEAAYRRMAQDAAKAALQDETPQPVVSETKPKAESKTKTPGTSEGSTGGRKTTAKKTTQTPNYTGPVDTDIPVGVAAPDYVDPYGESLLGEELEAAGLEPPALPEGQPDPDLGETAVTPEGEPVDRERVAAQDGQYQRLEHTRKFRYSRLGQVFNTGTSGTLTRRALDSKNAPLGAEDLIRDEYARLAEDPQLQADLYKAGVLSTKLYQTLRGSR